MENNKKKTATTAAEASPDAKRKPVRTLRVDDCNASIWAREVTLKDVSRVFYSVTLERSFKGSTGQYGYTKTFDADSLPKIVTLCEQAQRAIEELQQSK